MPEGDFRFEWADPVLPNPMLVQAMSAMFGGDFTLMPERLMDDATKDAARQFSRKMMPHVDRYRLLVWRGEELAGWSVGYQSGPDEYYMQNSGVLPQYRRQGLYTRIMEMAIGYIRESGAQRISSRHRMDNNPVLIAKLKAGFVISGMEVLDRFGSLVILSYYFDPKRRDFFAMRTGSIPPPPDITEFLDR